MKIKGYRKSEYRAKKRKDLGLSVFLDCKEEHLELPLYVLSCKTNAIELSIIRNFPTFKQGKFYLFIYLLFMFVKISLMEKWFIAPLF